MVISTMISQSNSDGGIGLHFRIIHVSIKYLFSLYYVPGNVVNTEVIARYKQNNFSIIRNF